MAAVCCVLMPLRLLAQIAAGEITGIVRDQAGAAVSGAAIIVADVDTGIERRFRSSNDGVYTAPSLAPGDYRVDVEVAGFKPVRRAGIHLATGEKARIDFDLAIGDLSEQVTVAAGRADRCGSTARASAASSHTIRSCSCR